MPTCGFSVPMRGEIDRMIGQRHGPPAIIAFYRHEFGEKVLSAPTTEGFNLLAWVMPFLALVLGGGAMAVAVGRWHSRRPPAPADSKPGAEPSSFDPELGTG